MNRALAVGAVTVAPGQNTNPSDEENVHPMVPGAAPTSTQKVEERNVDGVGYVGRPLSPILGHINNDKGARAYEFERQKVKRAGELVKRKAAKAAKAGGGYVAGSGGHSGRVASEGNGAEGGRREAKLRIGPSDMDVDIPEMLAEKPSKKLTGGIKKEKDEMPSDGRIEVSLSEFVLRQKKPRKVKDDDFEMISPVRPVIVLDDLEAREIDMDEPWEHVERDLEQGKKGKDTSYAEVVVGIEH